MRPLKFTGIPRIRIQIGTTGPTPQTRQQMIEYHNRCLSAAFSNGKRIPRIPRRRVDKGGFTQLLKKPGARAAVNWFWLRVLRSDRFSR